MSNSEIERVQRGETERQRQERQRDGDKRERERGAIPSRRLPLSRDATGPAFPHERGAAGEWKPSVASFERGVISVRTWEPRALRPRHTARVNE